MILFGGLFQIRLLIDYSKVIIHSFSMFRLTINHEYLSIL